MKIHLLLIVLFLSNLTFSQHTVGLFLNTNESYKGYTMFAPIRSTTTYLIDECGEKVHSWNSSYMPGLSAYILDNSLLLRTGKITNPTFNTGGQGGAIELINWESNIIWDFTLSNSTECLHHDIEYLPNGNILAIVWDSKTDIEATQAGRETSGSVLWSEKIIEIQPDTINNTATIVWEWKVWDHLVQNIDSTKDNYGDISSPELININYFSGNPIDKDWLHINSVDYNEDLDQIILSNHNFNEVWIIDHSTTMAESATNTGGVYNKGGDILYRWGNPEAYNKGDSDDKLLFAQHDVKWVDDTLIDGGMIMIFNNRAGYPSQYSTVNIINPPIDTNGNYTYSDSAFLPENFHWTYTAPIPTDFYGINISGAQRLPNGNTLICEGPTGIFFEVDYLGNMVWKYINPVSNSGILEQGDLATENRAFRCTRYSFNYTGFEGKVLIPQGYIETNSTYTCDMFTNRNNFEKETDFKIYPNPNNGNFTIEFNDNSSKNIQIIDITGKIVYSLNEISTSNLQLNIQELNSGVFIIKITSKNKSLLQKLIIN